MSTGSQSPVHHRQECFEPGCSERRPSWESLCDHWQEDHFETPDDADWWDAAADWRTKRQRIECLFEYKRLMAEIGHPPSRADMTAHGKKAARTYDEYFRSYYGFVADLGLPVPAAATRMSCGDVVARNRRGDHLAECEEASYDWGLTHD